MHLLRGSEPGLASPDAAGSLVRILFLMAGHEVRKRFFYFGKSNQRKGAPCCGIGF